MSSLGGSNNWGNGQNYSSGTSSGGYNDGQYGGGSGGGAMKGGNYAQRGQGPYGGVYGWYMDI